MRLSASRADLLKAALVAALQPAALFAASHAASASTFVQADDKSFDITLPDSWLIRAADPLRGNPPRIFSLESSRREASAKLEVNVDIAQAGDFGKKFAPKKLADLGSIEEVGDRLAQSQPQPAKLTRADKVGAGASGLFALATYVFRYEHAEGQSIVALALSQGRVYKLTQRLPAKPDAQLQAEAESILASFRAFPLNAGCLAASSKGQRALPGVCY
jgi:hypothetical protein